MVPPTRKADDVLESFLAESSPYAETLLSDLVMDHALPAIRKTVGRTLYAASTELQQDLVSEAVAALIARLRALRFNRAGSPTVRDFVSYAVGIADNILRQQGASRNPERSRLRRRIRLICASNPRFRIWETPRGAWWCGLAGIEDGERAASAAELEEIRQQIPGSGAASALPGLLSSVFERMACPVELNDLVFFCAGVFGIGGAPDDVQMDENRLADPALNAGDNAQITAWMTRLWSEIQELPERQRLALLLNLREPGGGTIGLFQDLAVATFDQLAAAVRMSPTELAWMWPRLPMSDNEIAERMGVTRQQVINLRSAARQRLARRLGNTNKSENCSTS